MSEFVTEFSTPATSQCNIIIPSFDLSTLLMLNNKKEHVILVIFLAALQNCTHFG